MSQVILSSGRTTLANITIRNAAILIFLGILFFIITGAHAPTSLIPTFFGLVLLVLGLLSRSDDAKRRMLVMHIAVTVGLVGFLFPAVRAGIVLFARYVHGVPVQHHRAVQEEGLMAVVCLVFVIRCVQSFIAARRSRTQ
jgi:uncharacterized membrane protein